MTYSITFKMPAKPPQVLRNNINIQLFTVILNGEYP